MGESDHPAFGPAANLSLHLASSSITPAGSVHKSRGDSVVRMLWMCVSFGSKVRPRTYACIAMGSALLCIFRSRLLVYSAGYGVNRVQVVLSGFSMRLFCCVQVKALCRYGCIYFLAALVLVCVDVMVMSYAWAMT